MPRRESDEGAVLEVVPVQPVVGGTTGEVRVRVRNPTDEPWQGVAIAIHEVTTSPAARRFVVVPSAEDGGYVIDEISAKKSVERSFCLRPVEADVGSQTDFKVSLLGADERGGKRRSRALGGMQSRELAFAVRVEARPETYAAIGAAEWLRETLLSAYERMQETGRRTQAKRDMTWPDPTSTDAGRVALGEKSFQALFEAVELGVRVARNLGKRGGSS